MRAVIQRVSEASVTIDNSVTAAIGQGLLVLLGIEDTDSEEDIAWLSQKIAALRIFDDTEEVANLSVRDIGGDVLVVSQFTLHAATRKGNRPSYIRAAGHAIAIPLYEKFLKAMALLMEKPVPSGTFGANMQVRLLNNGPFTIIIDTQQKDL